MFREPGVERSRRMLIRIRHELDESVDPGPWIAAARTLAATSVITENASLYLVTIFLECITFNAVVTDPEMLRIDAEMARVRRAHGLSEDEDWYVNEGPPEWQALNVDWERRDLEIRVATLRALGQEEVAGWLERAPEEFDERSRAGNREFWGERADKDL